MRTATPRTARAINDRLALDLLLERGPLTAPQLRALTGLSRPTVSDLIERLTANGLIEVVGETGGDRRGPNARLYGIVPDRAHVAGVDLRRDRVHVTVADITGEPVGAAVRELDPGLARHAGGDGSAAAGRDPLAELVAEAVAEAAGRRRLHTVTMGVPGMVDPLTGDLGANHDVPGWRPGTLKALRHRLETPVTVENEVNLAAIAEHRTGAACGRDDFVLLWLDDGVGAAVVLDGRLRRGVSGGAGEVGYLTSGAFAFCDLSAPRSLPPAVFAERVAQCAFVMVAVVDPGLVVLGGGTGREGGEELAAAVAEHLAVMAPVPVQVRPSTTHGNPVLEGAVFTALARAHDDVFGPPPVP